MPISMPHAAPVVGTLAQRGPRPKAAVVVTGTPVSAAQREQPDRETS